MHVFLKKGLHKIFRTERCESEEGKHSGFWGNVGVCLTSLISKGKVNISGAIYLTNIKSNQFKCISYESIRSKL
jgi:hypothetical protein